MSDAVSVGGNAEGFCEGRVGDVESPGVEDGAGLTGVALGSSLGVGEGSVEGSSLGSGVGLAEGSGDCEGVVVGLGLGLSSSGGGDDVTSQSLASSAR